jgi:4'-phosphopantetheinyl transferase
LESGGFGKPVLVNNTGSSNLQFSASHSNHIGMYAFTEDKLIGVDLEEIVAMSDWQEVMDICLSDYEKDWFSRLPSGRKAVTLIQIWTIKEAYLKAIGTGLAVPPANVELEFTETWSLFTSNASRSIGPSWT